MNVRELIEKLKLLDQDLEVYTAIDEEGNGYNSVYFDPTVMWARGERDADMEVSSEENFEDDYPDEEDRDEFRKIVVI